MARVPSKYRPRPDTRSGLQRLRQTYRGSKRKDVQRYLKAHPLMVDVLMHTAAALRERFPNSVLTLEVVTTHGVARLLVSVDSNMDGLDAIPAFEHFDNEWLIAELLDTISRLSFDLEYR